MVRTEVGMGPWVERGRDFFFLAIQQFSPPCVHVILCLTNRKVHIGVKTAVKQCLFTVTLVPALFQDADDTESTLNILNVLDELLSAGESITSITELSKEMTTLCY